jgi:hypothetical protein
MSGGTDTPRAWELSGYSLSTSKRETSSPLSFFEGDEKVSSARRTQLSMSSAGLGAVNILERSKRYGLTVAGMVASACASI